jgi:pyruvate dehydrogenase E2 component (dihydrolipoamide acetyltransferase)
VATKVYMEALSPTMEEGTLVSWLKNEGDEVKEGDVLAEVETDKATMELAARGAGVLRKRFIGEGDTAEVGKMIAIVAGEDEDISDLEGDVAEGGAPGGEGREGEGGRRARGGGEGAGAGRGAGRDRRPPEGRAAGRGSRARDGATAGSRLLRWPAGWRTRRGWT